MQKRAVTEDEQNFTPEINRTLTLCFSFNTALRTHDITNMKERYGIAN